MQIITKRTSGFNLVFVFFNNIISGSFDFCNELSILFLDYSAQFVDAAVPFLYNGFIRTEER